MTEIVSRLRRGDDVRLTLRTHGGDRRSEQVKDQVDNIKLKHDGGTSAAYTLARLDRDRPDLADAVRGGKLSANAADDARRRPAQRKISVRKFAD